MKLLCLCLVVLWCHQLAKATSSSRLRLMNRHSQHGTLISRSTENTKQLLEARLRSRRAAAGAGQSPVIHGNYSFLDDLNNIAAVTYLGSKSPVILVMTFRQPSQQPLNSKLYRSSNYGASFTPILNQLDRSDSSPSLWNPFTVSPNLVIIPHATEAKFYYSMDQGITWSAQALLPSSINPRSMLWNSANDRMAIAHDPQNDRLYVTQDLGQKWSKIADYVANRSDYQWGDPEYDADPSVVYFNTYNPSDVNRGNFTVSLRAQRVPYSGSTLTEFDPTLGLHDDFLLLGPYIFAQKTDSNVISLYVSYNRQPFQRAMIPATDPHMNYIVSHIDEQQAMVIVEHSSGQFNLYLSDVTGVYFSLSLPDIVVEQNSGIDLELIEGVNSTLIANQHVRNDPSAPGNTLRTLLSLDNGGNWELVRSPPSANCIPPQCSLHFHMTTSKYARTGVYSQASAPGLILAHGNTGSTLNAQSPDLYISRDGGVSWSLTLQGSWGVTVVDHGGLLVAAKDYHQTPSTELRYSCDEGISWRSFVYSIVNMTVYGVLTEPGEHTTTVSVYGVTGEEDHTWDVVTVNFSSIFPRICSWSDYYYWRPWDDRLTEGCILGSSVIIERRNASICCLIGEEYKRPLQFSVCPCGEEDFGCDYGYQHSDGFSGNCIRDDSIVLQEVCAQGVVAAIQSQGYRKVAGDVCSGGNETNFAPVAVSCISIPVETSTEGSHKVVVVVLAVLLVVAVGVALIFAVLFFCKGQLIKRTSRVRFRGNSPSAQPLASGGEDDDPLAL